MNDLNICCFLSLCITKDPEATAQELSISASTVQRNIKKLEDEIGINLFTSDPSKVSLTDAGIKFQKYFTEFVQDLAMNCSMSGSTHQKSHLHIGWCEWTGCPDWIDDVIRDFSLLYPDIDISVRQASPPNILRFLTGGEVDVAIISKYLARGIGEAYHSHVLHELPLYIVTSADGIYSTKTLDEFSRFPLALYNSLSWEPSEAAAQQSMSAMFSRLGWMPLTSKFLPNWDCAYLQVRLGNGITISPMNKKLISADGVFRFLKIPASVTLTANRLQSNRNPNAIVFEQFLLDRNTKVTL